MPVALGVALVVPRNVRPKPGLCLSNVSKVTLIFVCFCPSKVSLTVDQSMFSAARAMMCETGYSPVSRMAWPVTPEEMLGRVIAASRTMSWILIPVGAALGGWLADQIGLVPVYLFGSLAVIGVATVMLATPLYTADGSQSPTRWDRAIMHGPSTRGRE